ncbi:MAG: TOBE domain-containing protein, partial [Deltaproteobacteria bacterium]|nr:TOBE domain-containing protein [Deltaproteobacteria bacterium]
VGTPRELFNTPANTFVATFIGSPSMNLFPAEGRGTSSFIEGVDAELDLTADGPFTLGVRPTDLTLGEGPLTATVDVVESLGAEALVHLRLGTYDLVGQAAEPVSVRAGQEVSVRFTRTHRFHCDTGLRLE